MTRTRFAPSPTGYMHVGGLRTALYAYLLAKKDGGEFILRIEDTDRARFVEGATEKIYSALKDCGLDWDGEVTFQSERRDIYKEYAERLIELGGAYRDGDAVRQKIPREGSTAFRDVLFGEITVRNDDASLDEGVLLKSDGLPTYNFANVIDDHLMGITHVVRGSEYLSSAPKYTLLYKAFGWDEPVYVHVSPIMRDATHKLSKRNGDPTYEDLIADGFLKEAVLNYVALLGWSPGDEREKFSLAEMVGAFSLTGLSKSPALFDAEKLKWLNGEYIREMRTEDLIPHVKKYVSRCEDYALLAELLKPRLVKLTDAAELTDFLNELPEYDVSLYTHKKMKTDPELSRRVLETILPAFEKLADWSADALHGAVSPLIESLALKNGQVLYPLRVTVSGKASTPGGGIEICVLLGKDESLRRIRKGIEKLA